MSINTNIFIFLREELYDIICIWMFLMHEIWAWCYNIQLFLELKKQVLSQPHIILPTGLLTDVHT